MAMGNIGNLLQHFVALHAVKQLVTISDKNQHVTYIDPYAMAPVEEIVRNQPQGFVRVVCSFDRRPITDWISQVFMKCWQVVYPSQPIPTHPMKRLYPNTAFLLRTGFPGVRWHMRLHEIDKQKRSELEAWAREQTGGEFNVAGDWLDTNVNLVQGEPAIGPTLVMLDPHRFSEKNPGNRAYLRQVDLAYLIGSQALNIAAWPNKPELSRAIILLFSYSDSDPEQVNERVLSFFHGESRSNDGQRLLPLPTVANWHITRVSQSAGRVRMSEVWHQGWWVASHEDVKPKLNVSLQDAYDRWRDA